MGVPSSPGVTSGTAGDTLTAPFNDLGAVKRLVGENPGQVAALIVEPVAGNMGVILPDAGFLEGLREVTARNDIVLIFDEVITGFRVASGGAQSLYGVTPDMTTLGKIIGGGLPVGAFGGNRGLMENISPLGKAVSQAGTLSGNPLAMTAGFETLTRLAESNAYDQLEALASQLEAGIRGNLKSLGLGYQLNRVGSMMTLFFTETPVTGFANATACDQDLFGRYFREMLSRGIYLAPSQFEAGFVSTAHGPAEIDETIRANYESLKACHS